MDREPGPRLMPCEFSTTNVRAATDADVEPLAKLWFDGWHDAHASIVPAALTRLRTLENFRIRLRADLSSVRVLCASADPVGFAMLRGAEVYQFYVAASARGSGAAAALMADAEARLRERGVAVAWLACVVGNVRAARFYEKCGWRRTATMMNDADTAAGPFPVQVWRYEKALGT